MIGFLDHEYFLAFAFHLCLNGGVEMPMKDFFPRPKDPPMLPPLSGASRQRARKGACMGLTYRWCPWAVESPLRKRLSAIFSRALDIVAPRLPPECDECGDCNELNCTHERWLTCARRLGGAR